MHVYLFNKMLKTQRVDEYLLDEVVKLKKSITAIIPKLNFYLNIYDYRN